MNLSVVDRGALDLEVRFVGDMVNPLVTGAPAISWQVRVRITDDNGTYRYRVSGDHDGFPAYEIYADGVPMHRYAPSSPDEALKLFPPMDISVFELGNLP